MRGDWADPPCGPQPGAHLLGSGFRRSSSLTAACGAAAATAAAFTATAAATEALPGAPPGLEAGGPRDPRRRRSRARRGQGAGSCQLEALCERRASHPRPSSHNFAAGVGARSGAEGGESGARASPERAGLEPEQPARTGEAGAVGEMSTRPARRTAGELMRARASTLLCLLQLLHIYGALRFFCQ